MSSSVTPGERRVITSAIAGLIYQDESYLQSGISIDNLVSATSALEPRFSRKQMEIVIQKEILSGCLVKMQNGNLLLGPADHDADSSDSFKLEYSADFSNTKVCSFFFF